MHRTVLLLKMAADLGCLKAAHEAGLEKEAVLKYILSGLGGMALGAALMAAINKEKITTTADKIREGLMTTPPSAIQEMLTQGLPPGVAQHVAYYQPLVE